MTNSRKKGKRGELELAHALNELGFNTRRTAQYNGKETGSLADIVGIDGIHAEVKRVERLQIDTAYEQAVRDAKDGEIPTVFHRRNRKPWLVTMGLEDWASMYVTAQERELECEDLTEQLKVRKEKE